MVQAQQLDLFSIKCLLWGTEDIVSLLHSTEYIGLIRSGLWVFVIFLRLCALKLVIYLVIHLVDFLLFILRLFFQTWFFRLFSVTHFAIQKIFRKVLNLSKCSR